jgi:hypothetical protein
LYIYQNILLSCIIKTLNSKQGKKHVVFLYQRKQNPLITKYAKGNYHHDKPSEWTI